MIVTRIEEVNQKKIRVFIDHEFAFVLYKGELRKYHILEGSTLEEKLYREILQEVLPKRAKLRCLNLLKARPYTEKQLKDKLREGEYGQALIEEAVAYVKSYGYIDDRKYASDYLSSYGQYRSRRRIEQELLTKGVAKEIIREIFDRMEEAGEETDELAMAVKLLEKKNYHPDTASFKEKQKLSAFLYRKGFTSETIRTALSLDITSN
ncbi:MAG: regulatory protein RecX [Lachnospiraceae bacterium]|nr:regulatory protein RecX [Lachnospiraceae bacterium]